MKKLIALLLALVMIMALAACGNKEENNGDAGNTNAGNEDKVLASSALEILETIWNDYAEDEQFAVTGGDMQTQIEMMEKDENYMPANAPGAYNLKYAEDLTYSLLIPADELANLEEAATMVHMMNGNNFSCGAFKLKNGDVASFAETMKDAAMNNQWMCGQPEQIIVVDFGGGYVLMAYGIHDAMDPFVEHMNSVYADAEVLVEESLI